MLLRGHCKAAVITSSVEAHRFAKGPIESLSGPKVKLTAAAPPKIPETGGRREIGRSTKKFLYILTRFSPVGE